MYDDEIVPIKQALSGYFDTKHADLAARILVIVTNYASGDAWAGLQLRHNADVLRTAINKLFGYQVRHGFNEGVFMDLLSHKTGHKDVDIVLAVLDRCAKAGTGAGMFDKFHKDLLSQDNTKAE